MASGETDGGSGAGQATVSRATDARDQLMELDNLLVDLKTQYEQYFLGILTLPPDKLYNLVKRKLRELRKFPFKNSRVRFKLVALDRRFQTYDTYWQRVLREKESGVYSKDVFKAELRQRNTQEDRVAGTTKNSTETYVQGLFNSYADALERSSGKRHALDYERFKAELMKRAKVLKEQAQGKKVTFRVVDKGGKVTLEAKIIEAPNKST